MGDPFEEWEELQPEGWGTWRHAEYATVVQAACLLTCIDPASRHVGRVMPKEAENMAALIEQALCMQRLRGLRILVWDAASGYGDAEEILISQADLIGGHMSRNSTVLVTDLAKWCDEKGFSHPWRGVKLVSTNTPVSDRYPPELRAAVEAFEAVHIDPSATAGRTPKSALTAWLEKNKPKLSVNARERIVTVANWQPSGGAPKTPGE